MGNFQVYYGHIPGTLRCITGNFQVYSTDFKTTNNITITKMWEGCDFQNVHLCCCFEVCGVKLSTVKENLYGNCHPANIAIVRSCIPSTHMLVPICSQTGNRHFDMILSLLEPVFKMRLPDAS